MLYTNWPVFAAVFYSKSNKLLGCLSLKVKANCKELLKVLIGRDNAVDACEVHESDHKGF